MNTTCYAPDRTGLRFIMDKAKARHILYLALSQRCQNKKWGFIMRYVKNFPVILGLLFSWTCSLVHAQADLSAAMPLTREQVIKERDQFLKTHFFDTVNEVWVSQDTLLKSYGRKSRDVVQTEEPDTAVAKK